MNIRKIIGVGVVSYAAFLSLIGIEARAAVVPEGFSVGEISIQGMEAKEAKDKIAEVMKDMENKRIVFDVAGEKIQTNYSDLDFSWKNRMEIDKAIDEYTTGNIIERYAKQADLKHQAVHIDIDADINDDKLSAFVDENFIHLLTEVKDATISRENNSFKITESVDGLAIDRAQTNKLLKEAINKDTDTDELNIEVPVSIEKAKVTTEDLSGISDLLGTYTTDFSSSSEARATNIRVGAGKINGYVLMPGETLSGYECMHPFSIANGYKIAHAYENGRVVDSVGGGACQIATTLYNASLRAEVDITQRQNHSMTVGYVPASADAAIAGTYKDIKITNNWDTPIFVEGVVSGRKLTFNIWGKDDRPKNREIEFRSEILSSTPAGITYKDDPTLEMGREVRDSAGHDGRKSRLWKVVKVDGVETEKSIVSTDTYIVSNHIYRRGTMPVALPEQTPELTQPEQAQPIEGIGGGPGVTIVEGPGLE